MVIHMDTKQRQNRIAEPQDEAAAGRRQRAGRTHRPLPPTASRSEGEAGSRPSGAGAPGPIGVGLCRLSRRRELRHNEVLRSSGRSRRAYKSISVLKNSSMPPWSPDQGLKDPFSAVFWPWFSGVIFVFDLPTGQIATFSTGWHV